MDDYLPSSASPEFFQSPTSIAVSTPLRCTPVKRGGLNGLLSSGGAKRILPKNREKEGNKEKEASTPKSTAVTPAPARKKQHKLQGHYMNTTEASR